MRSTEQGGRGQQDVMVKISARASAESGCQVSLCPVYVRHYAPIQMTSKAKHEEGRKLNGRVEGSIYGGHGHVQIG